LLKSDKKFIRILGEAGIGKTTLVQYVLEGNLGVVWISFKKDKPWETTLTEQFPGNTTSVTLLILSIESPTSEQLLKDVLTELSTKKKINPIVVFDDTTYPSEQREYFCNLAQQLSNQARVIWIECDPTTFIQDSTDLIIPALDLSRRTFL
jgi:hypothetical protein